MAKKSRWKNDLTKFVTKIETSFKVAIGVNPMRLLGEQAIELIVKRTRLGYGVERDMGTKTKLKPLSASYVEWRKNNVSKLSSLTTPKRSNLTQTGQMLSSVRILDVGPGFVSVGPYGRRKGSSLSNQEVAQFVEANGRPFNYLSALEFNQLVRYYRRTFGDLVRNQRLTFRPDR